eukprot:TRINITY_DN14532_c0_g7_i1.p1 TRINITY_DN14532_c0_g7~~TRINITY_DN14532_c0_g7_i1.p1  ORF type:complete len:109 (-),score=4.94 TRINITY_DN14532_c0_g7_i1:53-379(-)
MTPPPQKSTLPSPAAGSDVKKRQPKTIQCPPAPADPTKEKCTEAKEAHCRRMVLLPISYFGPDKKEHREECGHGPHQDTKVWHAARIALDCVPIVNFNDHCGSIQANI